MISMVPIATVKNDINRIQDDYWGSIVSEIHLGDDIPSDTIIGLDKFSHITVVFYMHKVKDEKICMGLRHPRNNQNFEKVGIFSQRGKNRPNKIGVTHCKLLSTSERSLIVQGLDTINETLVLDIKPLMKEFQIEKRIIQQPEWSDNVMEHYFE